MVRAQLIIVKFVIVISAYAPQIGSAEEKDCFWDAVYDLMMDSKKDQIVVFGGDLNGHVEE